MTDRLKGCIVVFEREIRDDDAEEILNAIRALRKVLKVEPLIMHGNDYHAREMAKHELRQKLFEALK